MRLIRQIAILLSLQAMAQSALANDGFSIGIVRASHYSAILNRLLPRNIQIIGSLKDLEGSRIKEVMMCLDEPLSNPCFLLTNAQKNELIGLAQKFRTWRTTAKKRKDSFEKKIGDVAPQWANFTIGGEMSFQFSDYSISLDFFTQPKHRYQLVLTFPRIKSSKNEFSTHDPDDLYLDEDQVDRLVTVLDDANILKLATAQRAKNRSVAEAYK